MSDVIVAVRVPCEHCSGTGRTLLSGPHLHAYRFVASVNHEVTSEMYAKSDAELSRTNAANRLSVLEKMGLIVKRTGGRKCFYRMKQ